METITTKDLESAFNAGRLKSDVPLHSMNYKFQCFDDYLKASKRPTGHYWCMLINKWDVYFWNRHEFQWYHYNNPDVNMFDANHFRQINETRLLNPDGV